jgi:hypothetical protein
LAQAFQSLVHRILGKSDAEMSQWRAALLEALGPSGQLMINLIPELALIIGEQPEAPELPPQDQQARFQLVFRRFLGVFARPEHPLALFIDDLQWLDSATLDLIEHLILHPEVRHLLLIGAYRDNEVGPAHPLARMLARLREAGGRVQEIVLTPLMPDDVERLLADAPHTDQGRVQPLADLLFEKTAGNPFFTIQFLSALAEEMLLTFDPDKAAWGWDLPRIRAKGFTDNVADLMTAKLTRDPKQSTATRNGPAALTGRPRVYRLGRPRARRGSRLTSAARVSSARAPVRSSVRSAVERDKRWQGHQMRCPSCMAENAATRRFCAECGSPLPSPCPACGFENEPTARFCGGCGKSLGEVAAPAPTVVPAPPQIDSTERRQLTVMFCDLVGSTPLSVRFDPEDLREVVGAYHRCVADTIARFAGFVAKYMGDGVLIYFGYPEAHEDDAERAVRAGLAVIEAVSGLATPEPLNVRLGVASGLERATRAGAHPGDTDRAPQGAAEAAAPSRAHIARHPHLLQRAEAEFEGCNFERAHCWYRSPVGS